MQRTTVPVVIAVIAIAVLALVGVATASIVNREPLRVDETETRVVIRGCVQEDGCQVDYRFGDRWIIRQVTP